MKNSGLLKRLVSLIPGIIRHDFPRKFIALSFAILVYILVVDKIGKEEHIRGVKVNISYPPELVNLDEKVPKVTVRVRASERRLNRLTSADLSINKQIVESQVVVGEPYILKLHPQDVEKPFDVTVVGIEPNSLHLNLDRKVSRKIKVVPRFSSALTEGYEIGKEVSITPDQVTVTGPSTSIDRIHTVNTSPIPLDDVRENFEMMVKVTSYRNIKVAPPRVLVQVPINKAQQSVLFRAVPIRILYPNDELNLEAELVTSPNVDITVSGPKSIVELMTKDQLSPFVDVSQFKEPGVYNVNVSCVIAKPGVKTKSIYPENVQVKLTKENPQGTSVLPKKSPEPPAKKGKK